MIYLKTLKRLKEDALGAYPFNVHAINQLSEISFDSEVTIFIGENGCGKTTFLESLMLLTHTVDLIPEKYRRLDGPKKLSKSFKAVWQQKTSRGFYLKSQSFIRFVDNIEAMREETHEELSQLREAFKDRSKYALELAEGPYQKTLSALTNRYGQGLDKMSHGEGYLELFKSRLVPGGLYILDEPELSLSPMRQLSLISLIKEMVDKDCQFIIITHSPILMAYDQANIYNFEDRIEKIEYNDIEHVNLTRDFLNHPQSFLRHL
ncbi:ATP-binding cassette domain-containing protein [Acidaminobacter sp. JC074]|uniref:AAA family ATPase n=1 Tax=Acidaminobacter sp. JC074 TaxID=2530199 RepID=UPI001F0F6B50|nr:AAA family ATPase [Acidaminobacter sp. JC074]MCH4888206.1 ATP-binding cassette domain-containing protein [Acidaminobacter sp. JC074]